LKQRKTILFPFAALVLAALACGGSDPVTMEEITAYPGVSEIEDGNIVAETLAESIRESAGSEAIDVEIRMYNLPEGTTWEDVRLFYTTETGTGDWSDAADLTQETEFVSTMGWTRGGLMSPQAFVVAYSIDPLGGPPILIQMLFSE
jgi:hypothetical protein